MELDLSFWETVANLLILLSVALVLGAVFERLKQSAILGYLLAGAVLGPNAANLVNTVETVRAMAELGVALLLFSIGLEFSWRQLRRLGNVALLGGTLQVVVTLAITAGICIAFGLSVSTSVAVGGMVALSSTACVLRTLADRAAVDSIHGRNALGILLLQDLAVVPLVLIVAMLGEGGGIAQIGIGLGRAAGMIILLIVGFYLLSNYVLPRVLRTAAILKNRELLILLAFITSLGAAWAAHALGLSPILGAFVAGMLLAESPFAVQLRTDIGPLRALFVTLFFTSIGMLAHPMWLFEHIGLVVATVLTIMVGKTLITALIALLLRQRPRHALATGITLAQVGEFSFVLTGIAMSMGLLSETVFRLIVSATIVTMFLTPFLIALAPRAGSLVQRWLRRGEQGGAEPDQTSKSPVLSQHVIVVGFGPAGQSVADALEERETPVMVLELNPRSLDAARGRELHTVSGDARHPNVLQHAHLESAAALVVTLPDYRAVVGVIHQARLLHPALMIIARGRYHAFVPEIEMAGAQVVVDEERTTGRRLGREVVAWLRQQTEPSEAV